MCDGVTARPTTSWSTPHAFHEGAGRLLVEVQRIKSEGDYEAARALFDTYGIHFDPALRDEVVARVDRLGLPSYTGFVMPRLEPILDAGGQVTDVRISYPLDLETQMLEYSGETVRFQECFMNGGTLAPRRSRRTRSTTRVCFLGFALVVVAAVGVVLRATDSQNEVLQPPSLPSFLAGAVDPVIEALWSRFSRRNAIAHVRYISQFWRIGGNPGYDASIEHVRARLLASGFSATRPGEVPAHSSTWIEEYPNGGKGWSYSTGTLALARAGEPDEVVLSRDRQQIALCINSFPTPEAGLLAPLVDVGKGDSEADYAGKDVKGAVVLGDAGTAQLWRLAVIEPRRARHRLDGPQQPRLAGSSRCAGDGARRLGHSPVGRRSRMTRDVTVSDSRPVPTRPRR